MAFKFPLATVLQVRAIREEREERMLQQIMFEISQALRMIEQIDGDLSKINANRSNKLFTNVEGRDVHVSYGHLEALKRHKGEMQAHLEKLEGLKDMQLKLYQQARRDHEMLTDMRDDQREAYWAAIAKKEQKTLDDNFGARQARS